MYRFVLVAPKGKFITLGRTRGYTRGFGNLNSYLTMSVVKLILWTASPVTVSRTVCIDLEIFMHMSCPHTLGFRVWGLPGSAEDQGSTWIRNKLRNALSCTQHQPLDFVLQPQGSRISLGGAGCGHPGLHKGNPARGCTSVKTGDCRCRGRRSYSQAGGNGHAR